MSDILESVLQTILIDMIKAQNKANICSAKLAKKYVGVENHVELLEFFDVPNASIKSFDLELKFGLDSSQPLLEDSFSRKLSLLIHESIQSFVDDRYNEFRFDEHTKTEIKDLISKAWKGDSLAAPSRIPEELAPALLKEIEDFVGQLRDEVTTFTQDVLTDPDQIKTDDLKAVFNVNELKSFSSDILCSLKINAEIVGMKAGFLEKNFDTENGRTESCRKVFLVGQ